MAPENWLLIIDVQKGFINGETAHIPGLIEQMQKKYARVFASRFVNTPQSPLREYPGMEQRFLPGSNEIQLAFSPRAEALIFDKPAYSAFVAPLSSALKQAGIQRLDLCGIATENCVLKTAVDLFESGIRPIIRAKACASHAGKNHHEAGLMILERFIGPESIFKN